MPDEFDLLLADDEESGEAATPSAEEKAVPAPKVSSPSPVNTVEQARGVLAKISESAASGVGGGVEKAEDAGTASRRKPPRPSEKRGRKKVETGDGRCTAYAAFGTKCKLCGKVHPV